MTLLQKTCASPPAVPLLLAYALLETAPSPRARASAPISNVYCCISNGQPPNGGPSPPLWPLAYFFRAYRPRTILPGRPASAATGIQPGFFPVCFFFFFSPTRSSPASLALSPSRLLAFPPPPPIATPRSGANDFLSIARPISPGEFQASAAAREGGGRLEEWEGRGRESGGDRAPSGLASVSRRARGARNRALIRNCNLPRSDVTYDYRCRFRCAGNYARAAISGLAIGRIRGRGRARH